MMDFNLLRNNLSVTYSGLLSILVYVDIYFRSKHEYLLNMSIFSSKKFKKLCIIYIF